MDELQVELRKMFLEMMELIFGGYQISSFPSVENYGDNEDSCMQIWHTKCGSYFWDSWEEVELADVIKACYEHNDKCVEVKDQK